MRLNLGAGTPHTHILGYENLDKLTGWLWESGLKDYADNSVECITVAHTLMYVEEKYWPFIHAEMYRVLVPGGVVRITEDITDYPGGSKYGGAYSGWVTLTSSVKQAKYLTEAGFKVFYVNPWKTNFKDKTICQDTYQPSYYIEGVK
jgi:ubiquinone/menaquinone biosynthesis C-methylase UbiE